MRKLGHFVVIVFAVWMAVTSVNPVAAQVVAKNQKALSSDFVLGPDTPVSWLEQFVPDWRPFWDNSYNWTTNYGPAYRDTIGVPSQIMKCTGQFALCFHSGSGDYPCHMSPDGRSADCKCQVLTSNNYALLTSILNYPVYLDTLKACGADGSLCAEANQAPVCSFVQNATLIPGADVISTYDPGAVKEIIKAIKEGDAGRTKCSKGPYAACMTAPCRNNNDGTANCKCPVFYGEFQLTPKGATCSLGGDLVPSGSYYPGPTGQSQ